jgi:molecular chaperone HtpG
MLDSPLAAHLITRLEAKNEKISFVRVDADTLDKLIAKDEPIPNKLSEEEMNALKPVFEEVVEKEKFIVQCEPMSEEGEPVVVTRPEFMRRMKEQQMTGGGPMMMGVMPEMYNLVVNTNHPVIGMIMEAKTDKRKQKLTKQVVDLALLGQGLLKGEELTKFIHRSVDLIK